MEDLSTSEPTPPRRRRWWRAGAASAVIVVLGVTVAVAAVRPSGGSPASQLSMRGTLVVTTSASACPTANSTAPSTPVPAGTLSGGPAPSRFEFNTQPPAAREFLRALADRVTAGPADAPACGQYTFVHLWAWAADTTVGGDGTGRSDTVLFEYFRWRAADGSGRERTLRYPTAKPDPKTTPTITIQNQPAGSLPGAIDAALSPDPAILASQFNDIQPRAMGDQALLRATADVYGWQHPTRQVRVAILTILRDSAVRWRGTSTDRAGRRGVAVSVDSNRGTTRDVLIIDPGTGRPLAYEQVTLANPGRLAGPFPHVQDYQLYLDNNLTPLPT